MTNTWTSWNNNITHSVDTFYSPISEEELSDSVKNSKSIRVVGNGQSSADIAAGSDDLISLKEYGKFVEINEETREVTVEAGMILAVLLTKIEELGWTIPALPDLDTVSVGGALATGTHGTGQSAHPLSGYVVKCRLVLADGSVRELDESDDELEAVRVSLGVLGVLSTVTFRCEEKWLLQLNEEPMRDKTWLASYREWLSQYKFLRILWLPHTDFGYVIRGSEANEETKGPKIPWYVKYRRAVSAKLYRHTVKSPRFTVTSNRIIQKLFFNHKQSSFGSLYGATVTKSRGSTLELAEWTVALDKFEALFHDLKISLNDRANNGYAHIPMDIRFLDADESWLSYAYDRPCVTIGCVSRIAEAADSYEAFTTIEEVFRKHDARPHWAKRHAMTAKDLKPLYPKWDEFQNLRNEYDPSGKFLTPYLRKIFQ